MAVGYLTFGSAAEGLILNNYSEKAQPAGVAGGVRGDPPFFFFFVKGLLLVV